MAFLWVLVVVIKLIGHYLRFVKRHIGLESFGPFYKAVAGVTQCVSCDVFFKFLGFTFQIGVGRYGIILGAASRELADGIILGLRFRIFKDRHEALSVELLWMFCLCKFTHSREYVEKLYYGIRLHALLHARSRYN